MRYKVALVLVLVAVLAWFVWSNVGRSDEQDLLLCRDALELRQAYYERPRFIDLSKVERDIERYCGSASADVLRVPPTPTPPDSILGRFKRRATPTP